MRVLHVYRTFFPDSHGGLEQTIRQICLATGAGGVYNRVFTLSPNASSDPVEVSGIEVFQSPQHFEVASCGVSLTCWRRFRQLKDWADLIHYHFPWPFADVLAACSSTTKPSIITYHSDIVRQRVLKVAYTPLMHRFLKLADRIVCTSPNYLATSEILSRYSAKTATIPIGIDPATYPAPEPDYDVVSRYGSDYFLFVGVFRYYKGLHILLEAIAGAPYNVVIVGSGPTEPELRRQAAALKLNNVTFAGTLDDSKKVALLENCRGIVFPSFLRAEAFGVTLLEGAMFGKPLVSAEVGTGTSHVNIDGHTGIVVEPGSPEDLRAALDRLHDDPQLARQLGRNARCRFDSHFTAQIMGDRYLDLYKEVMTQPAYVSNLN